MPGSLIHHCIIAAEHSGKTHVNMLESNPVYTNQNHIKNMDTKMTCNESLTTVSFSALQTEQTPMAQTQLNDIDSPNWIMCAAPPQRVAQEHPKERDREMKVPILP